MWLAVAAFFAVVAATVLAVVYGTAWFTQRSAPLHATPPPRLSLVRQTPLKTEPKRLGPGLLLTRCGDLYTWSPQSEPLPLQLNRLAVKGTVQQLYWGGQDGGTWLLRFASGLPALYRQGQLTYLKEQRPERWLGVVYLPGPRCWAVSTTDREIEIWDEVLEHLQQTWHHQGDDALTSQYGQALSAARDLLVYSDPGADHLHGRVWVYRHGGSGWWAGGAFQEVSEFKAHDLQLKDEYEFGRHVCLDHRGRRFLVTGHYQSRLVYHFASQSRRFNLVQVIELPGCGVGRSLQCHFPFLLVTTEEPCATYVYRLNHNTGLLGTHQDFGNTGWPAYLEVEDEDPRVWATSGLELRQLS